MEKVTDLQNISSTRSHKEIPLKKKGQDGSDVFLLDPYDRYEYYVQKLRENVSNKKGPFEVAGMVDLPTECDRDQYPCIELRIRLRGMWLKHPITGKPMLSEMRVKDCFEGWPMQELFLMRFAKYLADTIPPGSPAENLKKHFETLQEGRSSKLPPRADLHLFYELARQQLTDVRAWLRNHPTRSARVVSELDPQFLSKVTKFFWWPYVERGDITLEMIESKTPSDLALQVVMWRYDAGEEAINSRLHRRKKPL
jgi:hypothetical protein